MRKKIIICIFLVLILATAIYSIKTAVDSYNYDIAKGVDIFTGFGAALTIIIGGFVVFYELDLFYTVYYLFTKPIQLKQLILVLLSNLTLLLIFFSNSIIFFFRRHFPIILESRFEGGVIITVLFSIYAILKLVHLYIRCCPKED